MNKIGVLGGTFDPIHIGHLMLADQAASSLGLSQVLFVPTGLPPHKDQTKITATGHRMEMVRLAVSGNDMFVVSGVECDSPGVSYTYATIESLQAMYGRGAEIYYIIGSDVLNYITKFRHFRRVLGSCVIVATARPGEYRMQTESVAAELTRAYGARIILLKFPEIAISSSLIRTKVANGESVRYMLPDPVIDYIKANKLYTAGGTTELPGYWESIPAPTQEEPGMAATNAAVGARCGHVVVNIEHIKRLMASRLSAGRYRHTIGVMETAIVMATAFGADRNQAAVAALLHDCMRETATDTLISICETGGRMVTEHERLAPSVLHAPAGAIEAGRILGVAANGTFGANGIFNAGDIELSAGAVADICGAIECHTTGKEGMGLLAKIIFAADAIEPGRSHDAALSARAMLLDGCGTGSARVELLDAAVLFILEEQIKHISGAGRALHPDTIYARDWLLKCGAATEAHNK
ncbi:MAG: nicotinate-nucleotide adenylyltransferase [Oscillospiraceae bacterium]|nr:nicotinate-nucleotide adenylyltransferase [Oscillospiraceae bacterium]